MSQNVKYLNNSSRMSIIETFLDKINRFKTLNTVEEFPEFKVLDMKLHSVKYSKFGGN